jgi:hypothetical protein
LTKKPLDAIIIEIVRFPSEIYPVRNKKDKSKAKTNHCLKRLVYKKLVKISNGAESKIN